MAKTLLLAGAIILAFGIGFVLAADFDEAAEKVHQKSGEPITIQKEFGDPSILTSDLIPAIERPTNIVATRPGLELTPSKKEAIYLSQPVAPGQEGLILDDQIQGDSCSNPFVVNQANLPYTDIQNSCNFTHNYGFSGKDVVYQVNLTQCMDMTFSLCNTTPIFDTYLWLYPGDDCGGTPIFTDDDFCMVPPNVGTSEISASLFAGTYYLVVDAYSTFCGTYTLDITGTSCGPVPPNDNCANAADLGSTFPVLDICGTTASATIDCPDTLAWEAVWYKFTVPYGFNDVFIDFCPSVVTIPTIGVILMDDCLCDDFIIASDYAFVQCDSLTNPQMLFRRLAGPATYYFPVYTGFPLDFCFSVYVTESCEITCPPGAFQENELQCFDGYLDHYNSGCNDTLSGLPDPPTIAITDGDTVCGTSGTHLDSLGRSVRDTDWYRFDLGANLREFTWSAVGDFPMQLLIIDAGTENCTDYSIVAFDTTSPCDTLTLTATGTGVFWLWAGPQSGSDVDCSYSHYAAWVHVIPPLQFDAMPVSVDDPQFYRMAAGGSTPVKVSVTNLGLGSYTFNVSVNITGDVSGSLYNDTRTASNVTQADTVQLTFDNFTPICIEMLSMTIVGIGVGEQNPANDTLVYRFKPHAFGMDTYHDGSSYWVYPLDDPYSSYAIRFHVPDGHSATLSSALLNFFVFGTNPPAPNDPEQSIITPWVALSDVNGNPDHLNPEWTSPISYTIGPDTGNTNYPTNIDLSSVGPFTEDFWIGFNAVQGGGGTAQAALRGEGELAIENAPDCNRMLVSGVWRMLNDVWANPTDVDIHCDYDLTGGTYKDCALLSIDSPFPAVIGNGPHDVLLTFQNTGLVDVLGAQANVTITGPGGVEFDVDSFFNVTFVQGTTQVDFGDWTASAGGESYTMDISLTLTGDQDVCNNDGSLEIFVIAGDTVFFKDFEANNGGFTQVIHSGPTTVWQWGQDTLADYPATTSAVKVWGTRLNNVYLNNSCASLRSPQFQVPSTGGALVISFWYQLEAPGDPWDFANVKINTGGGRYDLITPYGGYDATDTHSGNLCPQVNLQPGFNAHSPGWIKKAFDLTPYAGMNAIISIDFAADGAVVEWGIYLDDFTVLQYAAQVCDQFLPGDANMYVGIWPPAAIGADITYIVNYLRNNPINRPCLLNGVWASGDINGSCAVDGSDVIRFVNYLRGAIGLTWCPDVDPCWPTPQDLPPTQPPGWPNCENPITSGTVIPTGSAR